MPRAIAARASAGGSAEPPMIIFRCERSILSTPGAASSICKSVGTQWVNVTFSVSIILTKISGVYRPGNTILQPESVAVYGQPQAWTWNIGVIGM